MTPVHVNILLTQQLIKAVQGKVIKDIVYDNYNKSRYVLSGIRFDGIEELIGRTIIKANSNYIVTDNKMLAGFSYMDGGIRFFNNASDIKLDLKKPSKTGGYLVKFVFEDSCLFINLNSWACTFGIRPVSDVTQNPLSSENNIDITDENDFTLKKFRALINKNERSGILEACTTSGGAFNITFPLMNYIFWLSKVHPKTKVYMLSDEEINLIYRNTVKLIGEYKSGKRIFKHTDIYGKRIDSNDNDETLLMTAKNYLKPCPECNCFIDFLNGAGTKLYYCPSCQPLKTDK